MYAIQYLALHVQFRSGNRSDSLKLLRIERLAYGLDRLHALLRQIAHELTENQVHAFFNGLYILRRTDVLQGTLEIVDNRKKVL